MNLTSTSNTTSTTTDHISSGSTKKIFSYVNFSEFYTNIDKARAEGSLSSKVNFFHE